MTAVVAARTETDPAPVAASELIVVSASHSARFCYKLQSYFGCGNYLATESFNSCTKDIRLSTVIGT
nr:hypothetical protein JVH1_1044 [Rhodococcus sp. JVH1]